MLRNTCLLILNALLILGTGFLPVRAADSENTFTARSGRITIPADQRSFLMELSVLAKKYPGVVERSSMFEDMCEINPKCFYVASWTACCCDAGGATTCEAWPPQ